MPREVTKVHAIKDPFGFCRLTQQCLTNNHITTSRYKNARILSRHQRNVTLAANRNSDYHSCWWFENFCFIMIRDQRLPYIQVHSIVRLYHWAPAGASQTMIIITHITKAFCPRCRGRTRSLDFARITEIVWMISFVRCIWKARALAD